ncbi:MAG: isochorismatase family protein [Stenomitos rutilans HA7619-LM2]|jgi:nicotinamidase-related amidase|nr:isochorismatase family protein [Stenomitos rutilans HA7619-LM2]
MTTNSLFERLTPANAAMLLIDHQVGTMNFGITDLDALHLKNQALWLAEAAKIFDLPAVLTTSNPNGANGPLFPELLDVLPDVPVIDRVIINAWDDPNFLQAVQQTGRKKLIMAGVTTDVCLTFPAIGAVRDGFDVYAVMDASGTVNQQAMYASMFRMSQAGVKIANTNMVIAELLADWSSSYGVPLGKLYANRLPNFGFIAAHLDYLAKQSHKVPVAA